MGNYYTCESESHSLSYSCQHCHHVRSVREETDSFFWPGRHTETWFRGSSQKSFGWWVALPFGASSLFEHVMEEGEDKMGGNNGEEGGKSGEGTHFDTGGQWDTHVFK